MGSLYNHMPTPPTASADGLVSPGVPTSSAGRTSAIEAPGRGNPMEQRGTTADYAQTGLPSPYSATYGETRSEGSPADQQSTAPPFSTHTEVRTTNYSTPATSASDYSAYPASARSASFPEQQLQRQYHHPPPNSAAMAQQANNPSIAAPSPTYAAYGSAHSPYSTGEMTPNYAYPQQRPDWSGYAPQHSAGPMTPSSHVFPHQGPSSAPPQPRQSQVYSFVPIPGAQQHKRPRRRYEEIERMYKCGWNGCEKAYGTLNHLNAHVTMQSHGTKRTPEEFKEIRKEWKARKKEEEAQRKAEEERQRAQAQAAAQTAPDHGADAGAPSTYGGRQQLPSITYGQAAYSSGPPSAGMPLSSDYANSQVYPGYQAYSPHGQPGQSLYNQSPASGPPQNHH